MKKIFLFAFVLTTFLSALGAASVSATELVNINTADLALLETLPDIGPVKAQAIIDYRQAHGSFTTIVDIQKVKGIGPATFDNMKTLITVGTASDSGNTPPEPPPTATSSESTTASPSSSSGGPAEYLPIPTLRIFAGTDRTVATGADTAYTANIYDAKGNKRDAIVTWSFGDGMQRTGGSVLHPFYASGEYVVIVHASTKDGGEADAQFVVSAQDAGVMISAVSSKGIVLTNASSHSLDISWWKIRAGGAEFKFPDHTLILARHSVTFAPQVTELPITSLSAELLLPSGEVADTYPHILAVQPPPATTSYKQVQTVEPALNSVSSSKNNEDVLAPAATSTLAAAGAALSAAPSSSLMHIASSPWSYGLLGILVAGGAALLVL